MDRCTIPYDILTRKPLPEVLVALPPTSESWEVVIYMRFGGFNECPGPARHGAMLRKWFADDGAELVGISQDVLEIRVTRPPRTREAALVLAREQYHYCTDIVDQGTQTVGALAASLLNGGIWFFWWD